MSKKIITQESYNIDGVEYHSFNDLPQHIQKTLDKNNNGKADFIEVFQNNSSEKTMNSEETTTTTKKIYEVNGVKYNSFEELPQEIQEQITAIKWWSKKEIWENDNLNNLTLKYKDTKEKKIRFVLISICVIWLFLGIYLKISHII